MNPNLQDQKSFDLIWNTQFSDQICLIRAFNLDQNDPDLEIPCFAIQDQLIHHTCVPVFQSNIGLDHPDQGVKYGGSQVVWDPLIDTWDPLKAPTAQF